MWFKVLQREISLFYRPVLISDIVENFSSTWMRSCEAKVFIIYHNLQYCPPQSWVNCVFCPSPHSSAFSPPLKNSLLFYQGKKRRPLVCVWKEWRNYWASYKLDTCGINIIFHWLAQKCIQILEFWNAKHWNSVPNRFGGILSLMNVPISEFE